MIIPTAEFDPLFAQDGTPFRDKMLAYIRREFADLLGSASGLVASLDEIAALDQAGEIEAAPQPTAPPVPHRRAA